MLDERAAVAQRPAAAQLGIEVLQDLGGDLANGYGAERGLDVLAAVRLVSLAGVLLDLVHLQPRVERKTERGLGLGVLLGLDLSTEPVRMRLASSPSVVDSKRHSRRPVSGSSPTYTSTWSECPRRRIEPRFPAGEGTRTPNLTTRLQGGC